MLFNMKKIILSRINENIISLIFAMSLGIIFIVTHTEYSEEIPNYIKAFFEIILICVLILNRRKSANNEDIPSGKKYLYAWLVNLAVLIAIQRFTIEKHLGIENVIIIVLTVLCFLFMILKLFKIKLNELNYKINLKHFVGAVLLGAGNIVINLTCETMSGNSIKNNSSIIIFKLIYSFIYVAFLEETMNRGLFISGLKSYNIPDYLANIIQAIIFGGLHYNEYGSFGIQSILCTSYQMIFGYLIGMIYLRTKSLTPGIIIHALFDFGIFVYK